jgi:hypothetical protein
MKSPSFNVCPIEQTIDNHTCDLRLEWVLASIVGIYFLTWLQGKSYNLINNNVWGISHGKGVGALGLGNPWEAIGYQT